MHLTFFFNNSDEHAVMLCSLLNSCAHLSPILSVQHQFKARPYRSGGFGVGGENGVFKARQSDKPPTQPEPFNLRTEDRAARRPPRHGISLTFWKAFLV